MKPKKFSIRSRLIAFTHAWRGMAAAFMTEHALWFHSAAALVTVALALYLRVTRMEWIALISVIALVLICELINTCVELICDRITTEYDPRIKRIKDTAAGVVFLAAMTSVTVGALVFYPYFFST